jgi:hypothetical protein
MTTLGNGYQALTNFCVDVGASCARLLEAVDSEEIYTLSYTYTSSARNSAVLSKTCLLDHATQNQVVATSCWFESGQGHHKSTSYET